MSIYDENSRDGAFGIVTDDTTATRISLMFEEDDDPEDELPPILAPPSTGYLNFVDVNQPPPHLFPADYDDSETSCPLAQIDDDGRDSPEVVELNSEDGGSTTTDSDDELVNVDYFTKPPETFQTALKKYDFVRQKDTWLYNVRKFYKKQPTRIRRLFKMHKDADGNPIEEPIELLFERIHEERERMRKAQNIKREVDEDPDKDVGPASVVKLQVLNTDPELIQVLYPGNVVNFEKAIASLGGLGTISKTFDQPNKKLVLKFRSSDPFANGVNGQGKTTCGLLVRIRRRKKSRNNDNATTELTQESMKINLDSLGSEPVPAETVHDALLGSHFQKVGKSDVSVRLGNKSYCRQDLLLEDQILMDEQTRKAKTEKVWMFGHKGANCNLKIPKVLETEPDRHTKIVTLGIVHRTYDFNGICDFQYLPMTKKADGTFKSIKHKIFPMFGARDNPEKLVVKNVLNDDSLCQTFSVPHAMSRIDNPPRGLMEELIVSEKTPAKVLPPDESIFSNRTKRIIYTLSYNFQMDSKDKTMKVPSQPLALALADIERRQIKKELVEVVRIKFEERAIWSKAALEFATKIPSQTLKYIIPHFAYFASNGPWRNTWIKFDVDPRKAPINVIYQSVDFRIPYIYRRFMTTDSNSPPETAHKFLPEHIPSKAQMFYQLCDIKLDEIKELIGTLKRKSEAGTLVYDERYGFLKAGSFEYFRYIMTYYVENLLLENGKIPETETSNVPIKIPPGGIEPVQKMKAAPHRRVKQKRMRKSMRKTDYGSRKATKGKTQD